MFFFKSCLLLLAGLTSDFSPRLPKNIEVNSKNPSCHIRKGLDNSFDHVGKLYYPIMSVIKICSFLLKIEVPLLSS